GINRFRANRFIARSPRRAVGHRLRRQRLRGSPEARAHQCAVGSQHQSSGETTAIGDTARGEQQRLWRALCQKVPNLGDKRQRRAIRAMASCFGALRNDGVSPGVERLLGMPRSEEHTSELQSLAYLVCRLLLEKKK